MQEEKTHFGYQEVPKDHKQGLVKQVFDSVTEQYDLMNDVMSFGVHHLWKEFAVRSAQLKKQQVILDLAAGTCDLTALIVKHLKGDCSIIASDINASMLKKGQHRLLDKGLHERIHFVQANAECLPFPDNSFDRIFMGFGLRNVTDKAKALASIYRCLKPGGQCLVLEFSHCTDPIVSKLYNFYSFKLLPKFGQWIAKDKDSYQYLAESIRMHETQEALKAMFLSAGFEACSYENLTFGIVAIHRGFKF